MLKAIIFTIIFSCLSANAFSQTQDSSYVATPDSIKKDTTSKEEIEIISREELLNDHFKQKVFCSFPLTDKITSDDIDNSLAENVGDLLRMRSFFEVISVGSWGQPENLYMSGNGRGVNIFIDGNKYSQQDLNFPQKGDMDLNTIPLSSISGVEFLPGGLTNLGGGGAGAVGVNITTKDFYSPKPYSRLTDDRGPYGFRRTQVELGRRITSRGKFYLTGDFNKSDGYLVNSDCDGLSLSGKTTFAIAQRMDYIFSAYQYKTKMGLPLFEDANFHDTRKAVNNWGISNTVSFLQDIHTFMNINLQYEKQNQEIKSKAYNLETKKIEETISLKATQTFMRGRSDIRFEECLERRKFEELKSNQAILGGYLSAAYLYMLNPTTLLLLSSKLNQEEGVDAGISTGVGLSYSISKNLSLFGAVERSVGFPTLMDRFWLPFSASFKDSITDYIEQGDRNLKSQKSYSGDFGAKMQRGNYIVSAYIFGSKFDDFIFWSNVDTTIYYGHYKPINSQGRIWGANLDLSGKFFEYLTSYISYSFKRGENSNRKTRLPYSPDHNLFGYIQFENEYLKREIGLKLRLETNVISERFLDEYEKDKEPTAAILNGKAYIKFLDFHFYCAVRNITNQVYRLAGDYNMPQRTYWWGFYWEFFD